MQNYIAPKCFQGFGTQSIAINGQGYLIPCCWAEDLKYHDELQESGFLDPNLNLSVNDTVENILHKPVWRDFVNSISSGKHTLQVCKNSCGSTLPVASFDYDMWLDHIKNRAGINMDLGYRCILQCPACMRNPLQETNPQRKSLFVEKLRKSRDLPIDDLRKLYNFFGPAAPVNFCGMYSDPVYYDEFYSALEMMWDYPDKKFVISTAAHQKNIEWYQRAFDIAPKQNLIWIWGLDGLPGTSERYRIRQNSKLIFEAMILCAKQGFRTKWQWIDFDFNRKEVEQARQIAQDNGIIFHMKPAFGKTNELYGKE